MVSVSAAYCVKHNHIVSSVMMCRGIVGLNLQPSSRGPRGVTEMGYPMYPPSLYRAISYGSKLGVPMYITENGTPLTEDTSERSEWISGYLGQVCPCISKLSVVQSLTMYLHTYGMLAKRDWSW